MSKALDFLSKEGDEEALTKQKVAWYKTLKEAMKRASCKSTQWFLFEEFAPYVAVKPEKLAQAFIKTAEWLQSEKSLERRVMPWDKVIYMVHVPNDAAGFEAKYRVMLVFRATEHLQVL